MHGANVGNTHTHTLQRTKTNYTSCCKQNNHQPTMGNDVLRCGGRFKFRFGVVLSVWLFEIAESVGCDTAVGFGMGGEGAGVAIGASVG